MLSRRALIRGPIILLIYGIIISLAKPQTSTHSAFMSSPTLFGLFHFVFVVGIPLWFLIAAMVMARRDSKPPLMNGLVAFGLGLLLMTASYGMFSVSASYIDDFFITGSQRFQDHVAESGAAGCLSGFYEVNGKPFFFFWFGNWQKEVWSMESGSLVRRFSSLDGLLRDYHGGKLLIQGGDYSTDVWNCLLRLEFDASWTADMCKEFLLDRPDHFGYDSCIEAVALAHNDSRICTETVIDGSSDGYGRADCLDSFYSDYIPSRDDCLLYIEGRESCFKRYEAQHDSIPSALPPESFCRTLYGDFEVVGVWDQYDRCMNDKALDTNRIDLCQEYTDSPTDSGRLALSYYHDCVFDIALESGSSDLCTPLKSGSLRYDDCIGWVAVLLQDEGTCELIEEGPYNNYQEVCRSRIRLSLELLGLVDEIQMSNREVWDQRGMEAASLMNSLEHHNLVQEVRGSHIYNVTVRGRTVLARAAE